MVLLLVYTVIAIGFSFLCSIVEAVILSVTQSHISLLKEQGRTRLALRLQKLKDDVNTPLAAILTLNTIAHTGGAAGVGAQATALFGDQYLGAVSGVLTFLILVFSEIIPKTLGAHYWRQLAPLTTVILRYMIFIFFPLVKLSTILTRNLSHGPTLKGFNRDELAAMADLSTKEGQLGLQESTIIRNTLNLPLRTVTEILTPRTVVFSVAANLSIDEYFSNYSEEKFSRIPIYQDDPEHIQGFVLRSDLLLAKAEGHLNSVVADFSRPVQAVPESMSQSALLIRFLSEREQMVLVIDEYGGLEGIITLEDILEKMIGADIVDESDKTDNMRQLAISRSKNILGES